MSTQGEILGRLRSNAHRILSSGARSAGGALHSLSTQPSPPPPPPPAWPTNQKEANQMKKARCLKRNAKEKEQKLRAKKRKKEASRLARRDAEIGQLVEDVIVFAVEKASGVPAARDRKRDAQAALIIQWGWRTKMVRTRYARARSLKATKKLEASRQAMRDAKIGQLVKDVMVFVVKEAYFAPCARDRKQESPAALIIQWVWRTKMVRTRYARTCALKVTEKKRQRWTVRSIETAWKQFQNRKALAYNIARVNEKMALHRRKRAELMRAAAEVEGSEVAEKANDGLASEYSSAAVGLAEEAGPHTAAARFEPPRPAAAAAAAGAAQMPAAGVAGQGSGRLGDVLLNTIRTSRRRQEEEGLRSQFVEARKTKEAKPAQSRSILRLPPARKHYPAGSTEDLVPHPLQLLEGQTLLYSRQEFDLWAVMGQLQGWALQLGEAPVWGGGVPRAMEEYSVACGFSAAFGLLLFEHTIGKVFGVAYSSDVSGELPAEHVADMFNTFWEEEIAPFDAAERLFRFVGNSDGGGIMKEDLRPFLLEIVNRHPHLDRRYTLTRFWRQTTCRYTLTRFLAVVFYRHSRCRVISLHDLRTSGLAASLNATGRLEIGLEDSEYFSLARYEAIRGEYLSLCQGGRGLGRDALSGYRHDGGPVVGTLRASRVIAAEQRQRRRCNSSRSAVPTVGGQGQELSYDAWIRFYLCEEALMFGQCSERGIKYCFDLVDDAGVERVGRNDVAPFYEDMNREYIRNGGDPDELGACDKLLIENLDAMGVEAGREDVTLVEMRKPGNVKIAGRFFSQLFLGLHFGNDGGAANECVENDQSPPPPPFTVPYQQCQEHQEPQQQLQQHPQQHYQQQDQQFHDQPEYHQQYQEPQYHQQQQQCQENVYQQQCYQQYREPQPQYQQYQPQYQQQYQLQYEQQCQPQCQPQCQSHPPQYYQPQQQPPQQYQQQNQQQNQQRNQQYQQQLQQYQEPYHYQQEQQQQYQHYQQMCPTWGAGYQS